jgi:hypothetical protein
VSYLCSEHPCTNRDKNDDVKDSFYEELERVFHRSPKYQMKILLGDFNVKGRQGRRFLTDNWE